jgi:D-amino-acid oxidase
MTSTATANLPTPDFTLPFRCVSGLRPFREGGYRLEPERPAAAPQKFIVHNYGHGGAGITMSWGTASKVRDLVRNHLATTSDRTVAVLGSGVMGLTAATLLLDLGVQVKIYAEHFWKDTTSAVAGGQWAASKVEFSDRTQFKEILEIAYRTFKSNGQPFGVSEVCNYTPVPAPNLDIVLTLSPGLLPARRSVPRLPFEHHTKPGFEYRTLLIEPPIFLQRLDDDLRARGVPFIAKTFANLQDVLHLQENIIVNCTGSGAKTLWNDTSLKPIKGDLALLPAQPLLTYLYAQNGYMFPRKDAVVVGGSFLTCFTSTDPDPVCCKELVDYLKGQFGRGPEIPLPDCHIHHPSNRSLLAPREVVGV